MFSLPLLSSESEMFLKESRDRKKLVKLNAKEDYVVMSVMVYFISFSIAITIKNYTKFN